MQSPCVRVGVGEGLPENLRWQPAWPSLRAALPFVDLRTSAMRSINLAHVLQGAKDRGESLLSCECAA